jgi:hypothetical protein
VTINLKVVPQAPRVNTAALVAALEQAGVKPALLKRLVKKHTEKFGGAHIFTFSNPLVGRHGVTAVGPT